jgi:dihydrofolate reductase
MSNLIVINHVTLDGVMQAPARPDEDTRSGFEHGGWAVERAGDEVIARAVGEWMQGGPLLLGRKTYEDFYAVWPKRTDSPYSEALNNIQMYVVSTTLSEPLPWVNSTLLKGDLADAVTELKRQSDKPVVVMGSGDLIKSLLAHDLVDTFLLMIHPLVLGQGRRLFPEDGSVALRLVGSATTAAGVVIATYELSNTAGRGEQ